MNDFKAFNQTMATAFALIGIWGIASIYKDGFPTIQIYLGILWCALIFALIAISEKG